MNKDKNIRKRKTKFNDYLFTIFFVGLLIFTYFSCGEEYMALCGGIAFISLLKRRSINKSKEMIWLFFVGYYFVTTIGGFLFGFVEAKGVLKFFIQYPIMILILTSIFKKIKSIENTLGIFKIFIIISGIYGLLESVIKHNFIPDVFNNPAMERIATMNLLTYKYQSSSLFLHYTYFGFVLLVGLAINMIYPFRNKILNIVFILLCVVDLYFSKSRMCLLLFVILLFYDLYSRGKITLSMFKRGFFALMGFGLIIVFFWKSFTEVFYSIYRKFAVVKEYGFEYGSFGQRVGTLLNVPVYMLEHPLRGVVGTGFDSIKRAFLDDYSYFAGFGIADNQLTTFLIEVGIVGTIIVFVGIIRFFKHNREKRSLSKYLMISILFSSITLDVIGTIYITALVILPFVFYNECERGIRNV